MDGSPQLLTNIQFAEAKRGYNRDEVDNFLRALSMKVGELQDMLREAAQRAEAAEARLAEAEEARSAAEAAAHEAMAASDAATSSGGAVDHQVEAAAGVLALAQRTADAAILEAEAKARNTISDAKAKAAAIVDEVEAEVERLKTAADEQLESIKADRMRHVQLEVERLSSMRDDLRVDVDKLQGYLDTHKQKLREGVEALNRLLDDPDGIGLIPPATSTTSGLFARDEDGTGEVEPVVDEASRDERDEDVSVSFAGPEADANPETTERPVPVGNILDTSTAGRDDTGSNEALVLAPESVPTDEGVEAGVPSGGDAVPVAYLDAAEGSASGEQVINLTSADLFDALDDGTKGFQMLPDEPAPLRFDRTPVDGAPTSPLGEPDADADEAMRAFFERDLDQDDKDPQKSGRFLRRK